MSSIAANDPQRAGGLLRDAEQQVGADTEALTTIAAAYLSTGEIARTRALLDRIEIDALTMDYERVAAVRAFADVGDLDRATRLLTTFEDEQDRCQALSEIAIHR